ncbi:MAG TPA: hypothetical protein PLE28_02145 [bacterium]|nr:hypothetical protein [bacterium]
MDNDNNQSNTNNPKMDKNHKRALIILGVFSVAIISIWFINFFDALNNPFDYSSLASENSNTTDSTNSTTNSNNLDASNLNLKSVDTDGDNISDWDELFTYGSSPYLEDTDGDDLSDYEEIFTYKTDPNCLEGQTCSGTLTQTEAQGENNTAEILDNYYNVSSSSSDITASEVSAYLDSGDVDVSYLRELLLDEGFDKTELDKVSDEDLISVYKDVINNN